MPDIESYDPESAPEPSDWLSTSEWDRIAVIGAAHERLGIATPNPQLHATVHCIVENQIALDEPPETRRALERLRASGMSRHDAVHALGDVLAAQLHAMLTGNAAAPAEYRRALEKLGRPAGA